MNKELHSTLQCGKYNDRGVCHVYLLHKKGHRIQIVYPGKVYGESDNWMYSSEVGARHDSFLFLLLSPPLFSESH